MSSDATKNNTDVDKQYSNGGWVPIDSKGGQNANKGAGNHGKSGKDTQRKTMRANLHSNDSTTHAGGYHLLTNSRSPS